MVSGIHRVSRSSCVGSDAHQALDSWRRLSGRTRDDGVPREAGHALSLFNERDFFGREAIEPINQLVNVAVSSGDRILQHGLFRLSRRRP